MQLNAIVNKFTFGKNKWTGNTNSESNSNLENVPTNSHTQRHKNFWSIDSSKNHEGKKPIRELSSLFILNKLKVHLQQ